MRVLRTSAVAACVRRHGVSSTDRTGAIMARLHAAGYSFLTNRERRRANASVAPAVPPAVRAPALMPATCGTEQVLPRAPSLRLHEPGVAVLSRLLRAPRRLTLRQMKP